MLRSIATRHAAMPHDAAMPQRADEDPAMP